MEWMISCVQLLLGLGLLIVSAEFLLTKIITIAQKLGVSATLITVTVVALGTSLPELITSLMAAYKGIPDISVGNVVGSNLFNILAVIGVSCLLRPLHNNIAVMKKEWGFLLLATLLLWVLGHDLLLSQLDGLLFLLVFAVFLYFIIKGSRTGTASNKKLSQNTSINWQDISIFSLSMIGLLGGAHLALLGAIYLGKSFGMTERVIGLTIVSIGTGLPELATSMMAVFRKHYNISIANVIGSNVMNTLLIIGSASLYMPLAIAQDIMTYDYLWLIGITVGLFLLSLWVKTFSRSLGLCFIFLYGIYLFTLI